MATVVAAAVCVVSVAAMSAVRSPSPDTAPDTAPDSLSGSASSTRGEVDETPAAAAGPSAAAGRRTGSVVPEAPQRVVLPSGSAVRILPVATTDDGTLDVPGDVNLSGWWRGGSRIGDPFGSTLVAAHVDSQTQGLGPYAELLSVTAGQPVTLTSKHLRQDYVVTSLELVDKGTLPEREEIYSPAGAHRLTLVTCAGPFLPRRGGYQQLAVVTATPVGPPTQRAA